MWILLLVAFLALFAPASHAQAEWPKPKWEKVEALSCSPSTQAPLFTTVGSYRVKLAPESDDGDILCRAYLIDPAKNEKLLLRDWGVSVHQGTGEDVFGDGSPTLVLEAYSGGAHCCYTYEIVSLAEQPVILRPIRNESPFFFFKDPVSKQYRIMTSDGAFDYFDGLCHACSPFPRVVLKADHDGLHNVSPQFTEQYDTQIAAARARIGSDISKFLQSDFNDARSVVLEIVFSYLYSGRDAEAWETLDQMWPARDRERIRKLILETRAKGLLSKLKETAPRNVP